MGFEDGCEARFNFCYLWYASRTATASIQNLNSIATILIILIFFHRFCMSFSLLRVLFFWKRSVTPLFFLYFSYLMSCQRMLYPNSDGFWGHYRFQRRGLCLIWAKATNLYHEYFHFKYMLDAVLRLKDMNKRGLLSDSVDLSQRCKYDLRIFPIRRPTLALSHLLKPCLFYPFMRFMAASRTCHVW